MRLTTPLHAMLLLHYHTTASRWPQAGAPAVLAYTESLVRWRLIEPVEDVAFGYTTTPRGRAMVAALCALPLPEERISFSARFDGDLLDEGLRSLPRSITETLRDNAR